MIGSLDEICSIHLSGSTIYNIHRISYGPNGDRQTPVPDNNLQRHRSEVVVITVLQIYFVKIGQSPKIMILYINIY